MIDFVDGVIRYKSRDRYSVDMVMIIFEYLDFYLNFKGYDRILFFRECFIESVVGFI